MSESPGGGNLVSLRDVYDIVSRIEGTVDNRLNELERKMDAANTASAARVQGIASRMDRFEGRFEGTLGAIKWLGPAGIVGVIFGIARGMGYL